MEYFLFDYTTVKKEINFINYENFISNNGTYKNYLFDLSLLQHDNEVPLEYRNKAKNMIRLNKILILAPYPFIAIFLLIKKRRNFFITKIYFQERNLFFRMFLFLFSFRILQKALLKYQGDLILPEIKKEYKQFI